MEYSRVQQESAGLGSSCRQMCRRGRSNNRLWSAGVPDRLPLVGISKAENRCLASGRARDLHADRKTRLSEAAGDRNRGQAQHVKRPRVSKRNDLLRPKGLEIREKF